MKFSNTKKIYTLTLISILSVFSSVSFSKDVIATVQDGHNFTAVYDFGGIYGSKSGEENPLTGAFSCPSGYTSRQILSASPSFNSDLYYCYRAANVTGSPEYNFRGMYITPSSGRVNHENVFTGQNDCTTNDLVFSRSASFGGPGNGSYSPSYTMNYCYEEVTTVTADDYDFGGLYSRQNNGGVTNDVSNPITGTLSCPTGYIHSYLSAPSSNGSTNSDFGIGICASYPMKKLLAFNFESASDNNPPVDPPSLFNYVISSSPVSETFSSASSISSNIPVTFNSIEDPTRSGNLFISKILNSAGVDILNDSGMISANNVTFSNISEGQSVNIPITIGTSLPTGTYTATIESRIPVKYAGWAQFVYESTNPHGRSIKLENGAKRIIWGNQTGSNTSFFIPRINDYVSAPTNFIGGCSLPTTPTTSNVIAAITRSGFGDEELHAGNWFYRCNTTQSVQDDERYKEILNNIAETTVTITVTNPPVPTPTYDYNLTTPRNYVVSVGDTVNTNVTATKTLGDSQTVSLYIDKIQNSSNSNVLNSANGISNAGFQPSTGLADPSLISSLTLNTSASTPSGVYTVFPSSRATVPVSNFSQNGVSGTCLGAHISSGLGVDGVSGSNVISCTVNGYRNIYAILNSGFGVGTWNASSAADAKNIFDNNANTICGAGNWTTTTGTVSFSSVNTTETFSCTSNPTINDLTFYRTTAFQVSIDPYGLVIADGPCIPQIDVSNALTWNVVPNAVNGYRIYKYQQGVSPALVTTVNQPSSGNTVTYQDDNVDPLENYFYYIVGLDSSNNPLTSSTHRSHIADDGCEGGIPQSNDPSVTCIPLGINGSGITSTNKPQWQAEVSGGKSPFTFVWRTLNGQRDQIRSNIENFTGTASVGVGSTVSGPGVEISDANGKRAGETCPNITNSGGGTRLDLVLTQSDLDNAGYNRGNWTKGLKVRQGDVAKTYIDMNGIDRSGCYVNPTLQSKNQVGYSAGDPADLENASLDTSTVGVFNLLITCPRQSNGVATSSNAILEVYTGAVFEEF